VSQYYASTEGAPDGLHALAEAVREAPEGNRNNMLMWAVMTAAEEGYDRDDIVEAMLSAGHDAGLERVETARTVRSGISTADRKQVWGIRAERELTDGAHGAASHMAFAEFLTCQRRECVRARSEATGEPPERVVKLATKGKRELFLTAAADIVARRVKWLWDGRLAMGSLSLIGGREGQGKTLLSVQTAADITRGRLDGEFKGEPRNVIIVTSEDSWGMTIVPRLMAAKADLKRVYRVQARTADDVLTGLSLPHDFSALEQLIRDSEAALVVLDPLLSRLDANLDTHKDADVRLALEPLVAMAERTGCHITGLIHVNKSETTDPLTSLMASRAFAAVARAVLFVMRDPEDTTARLVGQPKNNLGRTDFPTLRFTVKGVEVGVDPDDGKPIEAPELSWLTSTERTIEDSLLALTRGTQAASRRVEAEQWLIRYLRTQPDGKAPSVDIEAAAVAAGITENALRRAREGMKAGIVVSREGFPSVSHWQLSAALMVGEAA
jgi:hypothetical protein